LTHQVFAVREGAGAVLRCAICRSDTAVGEGDFERMNEFVREHKLCLDSATAR
jgi:hypothetical protein